MNWLAVITLVLKAVVGISNFLGSRQLLEAGKAEILNKGLTQTLENLKRAKDVSAEITNKPDGDYANSMRDKYTRDD